MNDKGVSRTASATPAQLINTKIKGGEREVREEGKKYTIASMVCLHPFNTLPMTPTKLTYPEKNYFTLGGSMRIG